MASNIQYSGGTIVHTTYTQPSGTRREIVDNIVLHLGNAGWSTVSGAGTGDVVMKSALTADSNYIAVRVYDPGSGSCARVAIRNETGTIVGQDNFLLPAAGKIWRVVASKYGFAYMGSATVAREFVMVSTIIPQAFAAGVVSGPFGFASANAVSDSDTVVRPSFRSLLHHYFSTSTGTSRFSGIIGASLLNFTGGAGAGLPVLLTQGPGNWNANNTAHTMALRYIDDTYPVREAEIAWGPTAVTDEGKICGIIPNAITVPDNFAADDLTNSSYDGHAWIAITGSNSGNGSLGNAPGTLLLAVS